MTFASELAAKWGANVKSTPLAGLLHFGRQRAFCVWQSCWPTAGRREDDHQAEAAPSHGACVRHRSGWARRQAAGYRVVVAPDGAIWVSWPKKSTRLATDLTDVVVRETALPLGLVDIKVCSIDAIWSGLKFVIPKEQR